MAKIMLVEDDNNLREIYEARLLAEGYEIVTARDGEEALAVAVKERPDLIISDVMMPKISGFDMLDILRSTPETKDVKVIMMTALSQAEDKERASKLGANRYLVKSQVTLEDVAKVAHEVLEGTTGASPAVAAPAPAVAPAPEPTPVVAPVTQVEPVAVVEPVVTPTVVAVQVEQTAEEPATDVSNIAANTVTSATAGITDLNSPIVQQAPVVQVPEMPEIEKQPDELWSTPATTPETTVEPDAAVTPIVADSAEVTSAYAVVNEAATQTLEQEEAAIAKQIENIIDTTPAPTTESSITIPVTTEPAESTPVAADPVTSPSTSGEKVIQPLVTPAGPDIHELAAKEEASENGHVSGSVIEPTNTPTAKPAGGIDPSSLAL
ncbi:MAG: response regulator [bacterium]